MPTTRRVFGAVELNADQPTELTFAELREWVIWQFPRQKEARSLCGAVHPPHAEYGWLPALIAPRRNRLEIQGHVEEPFSTPEAAAEWMARERE